MTAAELQAASKKRVEAARRLSASDFNVWKHDEDRADQALASGIIVIVRRASSHA